MGKPVAGDQVFSRTRLLGESSLGSLRKGILCSRSCYVRRGQSHQVPDFFFLLVEVLASRHHYTPARASEACPLRLRLALELRSEAHGGGAAEALLLLAAVDFSGLESVVAGVSE